MTISRKDTIILAVLMNVGFLAILFITALHYDEEAVVPMREERTLPSSPISQITPVQTQNLEPIDEVDQVIEQYTQGSEREEETQIVESAPVEVREEQRTVRITVKPGDALEKIARANGTTVRELKRLNHLDRDFLRIGQILTVPVHERVEAPVIEPEIAAQEEIYYTMRQGDNPWKVARKFPGVTYYDILRLNNLDEDRARSLRVGDKIRVR